MTGIFVDRDFKDRKNNRISFVLETLQHIKALLDKTEDERALIRDICDFLVENHGYDAVCIGLAGEGHNIEKTAVSGFSGVFSRFLDHRFACSFHKMVFPDRQKPEKNKSDLDFCRSFCFFPENDSADRVIRVFRLECAGISCGFMALSMPWDPEGDETEKRILKIVCDDIAGGIYRLKLEKSQKDLKQTIAAGIMDIPCFREARDFLRIEDRMTSLGRVTAGIVHEIRNPLSGIYIYLKALKNNYSGGDQNARALQVISKIELAAYKIESIVKRVMDFAKPGTPRFIRVCLNDYIDEATQLARVALRKNSIQFEKHLDPALPECHADPQLIEQVVLNLVTNAGEAMKNFKGEKRIILRTFADDTRVFISVSDTGPGIPSSKRDRIFDPFFTTKSNSAGIGLSICHRIICDHGGALKLHTSEDKGACFVIELPIEKPRECDGVNC